MIPRLKIVHHKFAQFSHEISINNLHLREQLLYDHADNVHKCVTLLPINTILLGSPLTYTAALR